MSSEVPSDLRYAKTHEWVRVEGEVAMVGITDHAQQELTEVVFVELPEVGRQLKAGESCAVVESVKTASDVYAPISGEVIAINGELADHPERVNSEPYAGGWFFRVKVQDPRQVTQLMNASDYQARISPP